MWAQKYGYCYGTCPYGIYGSGWTGEIVATANTCQKCNDYCVVCYSSTTQCYICKDSAYLLDIKTDCETRYKNNATCTACSYACPSTDYYCMPGGCPAQYFFKLKRNWYLSDTSDHGYEDAENPFSFASSA